MIIIQKSVFFTNGLVCYVGHREASILQQDCFILSCESVNQDITGHLDILTWRTKGQKSSDWSFYLLYETNSTFQKAETTLTHLCSAVRRETVHQSEQKSSPPVKTPTWLLSKLPGVRLLILNPVTLSDPDPATTVKLLEGHKMQNWVGGRRRHQKQ